MPEQEFNLEDIEIPIQEFDGGELPDSDAIQGMIKAVQNNIKTLQKNG